MRIVSSGLWGLGWFCAGWEKEEAFCGKYGTHWNLLVLAFQPGLKPLAKHNILFLRKEIYKAQKTLDIKWFLQKNVLMI